MLTKRCEKEMPRTWLLLCAMLAKHQTLSALTSSCPSPCLQQPLLARHLAWQVLLGPKEKEKGRVPAKAVSSRILSRRAKPLRGRRFVSPLTAKRLVIAKIALSTTCASGALNPILIWLARRCRVPMSD